MAGLATSARSCQGAQRELDILAGVESVNWRIKKRGEDYELWLPTLESLGEDDDGLVSNIA